VLRAGSFGPDWDSLEWLRRVLASEVAERLAALELHLLRREGYDWSEFVGAHHRLAVDAPFKLMLRAPRAVNGSTALPAIKPTLGVEAYGSGARYEPNQRSRDASGTLRVKRNEGVTLCGATVTPGGWVSLREGDWLSAPGTRHTLVPLPPRATKPSAQQPPWVLLPAEQWHHAPLRADGDLWSFSRGGKTSYWKPETDGLRVMHADESEGELVPWFCPCRVFDTAGVVFLPGASPFLSGQNRLPEGVLSPTLVQTFAAELKRGEDIVADGLACLVSGGVEAKRWWPRLLAPYGGVGAPPAASFLTPRAGKHIGGFFEMLSVTAWVNFERDLPVVLSHPLMVRLRRLEIWPVAAGDDLSAIGEVARSLRDDVETHLHPRPLELERGDLRGVH
jgi:hypothetical protein